MDDTETTVGRVPFNGGRHLWDVRRVIRGLFVFYLCLSSCVTGRQHQANRSEIEAITKRLVARRESWADRAYLEVQQDRDGTWRVATHAIDPQSDAYRCLLFVKGTGRELLFSPKGKLISYVSLD